MLIVNSQMLTSSRLRLRLNHQPIDTHGLSATALMSVYLGDNPLIFGVSLHVESIWLIRISNAGLLFGLFRAYDCARQTLGSGPDYRGPLPAICYLIMAFNHTLQKHVFKRTWIKPIRLLRFRADNAGGGDLRAGNAPRIGPPAGVVERIVGAVAVHVGQRLELGVLVVEHVILTIDCNHQDGVIETALDVAHHDETHVAFRHA